MTQNLRLTIPGTKITPAQVMRLSVADSMHLDEASGRLLLVSGRAFLADDLADAAPLDADAIWTLYEKQGTEVCEALAGLYTIAVYDAPAGNIYLFQDRFSGAAPLYFTRVGQGFSADSSLKRLIRQMPAPRALNQAALEDFLLYGVLKDERTLVKGIMKLPRGKRAVLHLRDQRAAFFPNVYCETAARRPETFEDYGLAFREAVRACMGDAPPAITLSGGYDSNLILWSMRAMTSEKIKALTIGGRKGVDETETASRAACGYDGVEVLTGHVDGETLERLPDIVFRLEGSVFESGIFLQYELGRLAQSRGVTHLVLGDGADQMMDVSPRLPWIGLLRRYAPWLGSEDMNALVVLKKNALTLTSFGVDCRYPYLEERFLRMARALRFLNGTGKYYHKHAVSAIVPDATRAQLKKVGGSTHVSPLFTGKIDYEHFKRRATALKYHDPRRKIRYHKSREESEIEYVLQLMYLHLFEEIFLSGRYDGEMDGPSFDVPLSEFYDGLPEAQKEAPIHAPRSIRGHHIYSRLMRLCSRCVYAAYAAKNRGHLLRRAPAHSSSHP